MSPQISKTRVVSVSRNVIFYEDCFPFTNHNKLDPITILPVPTSSFHDTNDQFGDFNS